MSERMTGAFLTTACEHTSRKAWPLAGARTPTNAWMLLLAASLALLAGCNGRKASRFADASDMERYANLPLAAASHHADLRAELAQVQAEQGTPALLAAETKTLSSSGRDGVPGVVSELADIFPSDTLERFQKRLEALYPDASFQFAPLVHDQAMELLKLGDERRRRYQRVVGTPNLPPVHPHASGITGNVSYVTAVEVGNRLLGLTVAECVQKNQLETAVDALQGMFRGAEWLSREKHTLPRLAAVQRRAEALAALGAIARHPQATPAIRARLLELVQSQLERWPPDSQAWIGERAEGLLTYELVRDGYLISLIPFDELRRIREDVGVDKLGEIVAANIDHDQVLYLRAMRKIIAACDQPFTSSQQVFLDIESDLEGLRTSDRYPYVADQLLLLNVADRQRLVTLDCARMEAWRLALQLAAGSQPAEEVVNPLTGQPFTVQLTPQQVSVSGIDAEEAAIELPRS